MMCWERPFEGENFPQGNLKYLQLHLILSQSKLFSFMRIELIKHENCGFQTSTTFGNVTIALAVALVISKGRYKQPPQHVPKFIAGQSIIIF